MVSRQPGPEEVAQLLGEYVPRLRAFLRLRLGPELRALESSMDLAQSVCRELLEGGASFEVRSEREFVSWLFRAALTKIRNRHRFHHREQRDAARRAPLDTAAHADYCDLGTPSRIAGAREDVDRLERAFDALSEDHREVITLHRIVGLSHAEIGAQLGRSEAATRKLLGRALVALGQQLRRGG